MTAATLTRKQLRRAPRAAAPQPKPANRIAHPCFVIEQILEMMAMQGVKVSREEVREMEKVTLEWAIDELERLAPHPTWPGAGLLGVWLLDDQSLSGRLCVGRARPLLEVRVKTCYFCHCLAEGEGMVKIYVPIIVHIQGGLDYEVEFAHPECLEIARRDFTGMNRVELEALNRAYRKWEAEG